MFPESSHPPFDLELSRAFENVALENLFPISNGRPVNIIPSNISHIALIRTQRPANENADDPLTSITATMAIYQFCDDKLGAKDTNVEAEFFWFMLLSSTYREVLDENKTRERFLRTKEKGLNYTLLHLRAYYGTMLNSYELTIKEWHKKAEALKSNSKRIQF